MIEAAGLAARFLYTCSVFLAIGVLVVLALLRDPAAPLAQRARAGAALALACALLLAFAVLVSQALALAGTLDTAVVARLLGDSRFGTIWLLRQGALSAACVALLASHRAGVRGAQALALGAALFSLACAPWAGHSATAEPGWQVLPAHALHLAAAAAWLGSLPVLLWLLVRHADTGAATLSRFSRVAPAFMLAIVVSGGWLAVVHVERWPALLGTRYGALLLGKVALLAAVLALAARLRRGLRDRTAGGAFDQRTGVRWLALELVLAIVLLSLATSLAQSVPARHDAITWLLPLRISIDATWGTPGVATAVIGLAAFVAITLAAALWFLHRRARAGAAAAAVAASVCLVFALRALSVDAYPDTYRRPSVPYHAISVASGAGLFAHHCVRCHGASAHGDGPDGRSLALPPADLTEPHTALHTAGDLFWWLTHGKPPGAMPGFAAVLAEDDRWDLINFLRTLSAGYQARILNERVVPGVPWLPAIDFSYQTADGRSGALKDHRGRGPVLLVFYSLPASAARLAQLAAAHARLRAAGVELLAIPLGDPDEAVPAELPTVIDGAAEAARTYALLRRTLSDADARDSAPIPAHLEMLVDRFGYIRARWLPGDTAGWGDLELLLGQLALLAREPQVRPPPDDHVH